MELGNFGGDEDVDVLTTERVVFFSVLVPVSGSHAFQKLSSPPGPSSDFDKDDRLDFVELLLCEPEKIK